MQPLHILVPLDDTAFGAQIYAPITRLFAPAQTRLTLLHVAPPLPAIRTALRYSYGEGAELPDDTFDKEGLDPEARQRWAELEADAARLRALGYAAQALVRLGQPVEEIVAYVEAERPDLIAMVTHGHSGLGQLIFGSVAQAVLAQVEIPLLVLRR